MKHVKLFEAYTDGDMNNMSPEDFELEVENIIKMDIEDGARAMYTFMRDKDPVLYSAGLKKYTEWAKTLSDEQRDTLRKAVADKRRETDPSYKSYSERDAENAAKEKAKEDEKARLHAEYVAKIEAERKAKQEEREKDAQREASLRAELKSKMSNILDKLVAGEISKEEALNSFENDFEPAPTPRPKYLVKG